jgi:DNA uptake protein ComE-like DNA-binding protein
MKGFIAGLGIGALIGVVIAPKAGEETRQELLNSANRRLGEVKDNLNEVKDSASKRIHNIKEQDTVSAEAKKISGSNSLLDIINDWPQERLIEIDGIGPVLASKIIENRPYKEDSDLLEAKILPPSAVEALRKAA